MSASIRLWRLTTAWARFNDEHLPTLVSSRRSMASKHHAAIVTAPSDAGGNVKANTPALMSASIRLWRLTTAWARFNDEHLPTLVSSRRSMASKHHAAIVPTPSDAGGNVKANAPALMSASIRLWRLTTAWARFNDEHLPTLVSSRRSMASKHHAAIVTTPSDAGGNVKANTAALMSASIRL